MERIKNLVSQVAIINKKNMEILDAIGGRFNMFKVCGVNHYENTHSAIIAEFLNPNGTHGLKDKLLKCFKETLSHKIENFDFNSEKAQVHTEYTTEEGRIDILLEDNQNRAIIIENKVYAADQTEQLKRYNRYAEKYKNGYQILYLTLMGDEASEQSGGGVNYIPISYKEHIINWLENCVAIASRFPIVRETIVQYINHLKQLTNQDMYTKNQEEITKFLSNIDNLRAAKAISQNYAGTFNFLMEKHFNPKMGKFAEQRGLEYQFNGSDETHVRFSLSHIDWDGKYWMGFSFDNNQFYYGICNNYDIFKVSEKNRSEIHTKLHEMGVLGGKESGWWPFHVYTPHLSLDIWEDDIVKSDNFVNDCKNKIEELLKVVDIIEL